MSEGENVSSLNDIQAAIAKLERLVMETVNSGQMSAEIVQTAARMIQPALKILRTDARLFESADTDDLMERAERAFAGAGDQDLVDAILIEQTSSEEKP